MTAHPESVVGRLRAANAALEAERAIPGSIHRRELDDLRDAVAKAYRLRAPALLAALEKVWAYIEPIDVQELQTKGARQREIDDALEFNNVSEDVRTILAPLFEKPEKTT